MSLNVSTEWTEAELVQGRIEIHNHPPGRTYNITWKDNCGTKTDLVSNLETFGGTGIDDMPAPSSVGPGFRYLCPPIEPGKRYEVTLYTDLAKTKVTVYVPYRPPDLTIERIVLPNTIAAGQAITVGVGASGGRRPPPSHTQDHRPTSHTQDHR